MGHFSCRADREAEPQAEKEADRPARGKKSGDATRSYSPFGVHALLIAVMAPLLAEAILEMCTYFATILKAYREYSSAWYMALLRLYVSSEYRGSRQQATGYSQHHTL